MRKLDDIGLRAHTRLPSCIIILGGIISGVFTATEAGAAAAVYALFLTVFVYREIKISELPEILWECCLTNAVVMMLIATCSVYSWILTYENLPTLLAENFFNLIQGASCSS